MVEIYCFNLKKSADEAQGMFAVAYDKVALRKISCREFQNGELTSKAKNVAESPKCTDTGNWKQYQRKVNGKRKNNFPRNLERRFEYEKLCFTGKQIVLPSYSHW